MDIILGYIGGANVGKDTANNLLKRLIATDLFKKLGEVQNVGYCPETFAGVSLLQQQIGFFYIPLALEVKKEYARQNPSVELSRLFTDVAYKNEHRKGLIEIGDGWRETKDPLIWIQRACENIELIRQKYAHLAHRIYSIPDMRYINEPPAFEEYAEKREWPILLIKVNSSLPTRLARMTKDAARAYMCKYKNNKSERNNKYAQADFDVFNDGTLDDLMGQLRLQVLPVLSFLFDIGK